MFARIIGTGSYLPIKVLKNDELTNMVNTNDEWIRKRVGIKQRHIADSHESTTFMAIEASKKAIKSASIDSKDIDLIIVATGTSDYIMPSVASMVQAKINNSSCIAFDVNAACSGFIYAIDIARQYIENKSAKVALVIASERMSRTLDWSDRSTCVLFGDGAGATVLSQSNTPGIITSKLDVDGEEKDMLNIPGLLEIKPFSSDKEKRFAKLQMEGNKVFKRAISILSELTHTLLKNSRMNINEIDWLIPHQANYRIIEAISKKINLPMSKIILTLESHGNTSAASIPLALDYAIKNNSIRLGQNILMEAFGSGIVWGGFIAKI